MIKVGIIGGAGYTAGELLRILVNHPEVEIVFVHSTSNAGNFLYDVHGGLFGDTQLRFSDSYVYGLPEWQRDKILGADKIANPGCFATAIQLALLPLAAAGLLKSTVHVTAITGSTGAGVKPSATTHFSWRTDNLSTYKVFEHQHLKEIGRNLGILQGADGIDIQFVPMRGDFARGIFASVTVETPLTGEEALKLYQDYYAGAAFTFVSDRPVDLKQVVNTNKAIVAPEVHGGTLVVSSVIDNLLKGASGQAVQNMNLIFGIPETTGLKLKASAF